MRKKYGKAARNKFIVLSSIFFGILLIAIFGFYFYVRDKIYAAPQIIDTNLEENYNDKFYKDVEYSEEVLEDDVHYEEQKGIINFLLIGVDARNLSENCRSDSIVIATIDTTNRKLKFTTILRDTYIDIKKHKSQKINAAYALGGPELLMDTIERAFKIKLDKYIIINFWGFEEIIDLLGGVEIEVKDYEISEINKYIGEVDKQKSLPIVQSGLQHLDGQQALAYARIRQVGNGSYERAKRQREVLFKSAKKIEDIKVIQYAGILSKILPHIKTNIEPINFLNYAYTISKFGNLNVEGMQMPMSELSVGGMYKGTWVFMMDKEQNAKVLNDFIFRDKLPKVEELNMRAFRSKINQYFKIEENYTSTSKNEEAKVKEND